MIHVKKVLATSAKTARFQVTKAQPVRTQIYGKAHQGIAISSKGVAS